MKKKWLLLAVLGTLSSCQSPAEQILPTLIPTIAVSTPETPTHVDPTAVALQPTHTPPATETGVLPTPLSPTVPILTATEPTPTVTPLPETTPTPAVEPTATYWPTVTRQLLSAAESANLVPCTNRSVTDDLLIFVSQQYSLPQFYVPTDLALLTDYFDSSVVLDQELYVRQVVIDPLQRMMAEMNDVGLRPSIISAYRSYGEQSLAWGWWSSQYPGRVAIMSARAGNSEHQLGTTVDFGSPALDHLFHVDFANTAEGVWLANNAHRFGFTLSYPADSYATTGFKFEPWHFRYVGTSMATQLFNSGQILTDWQIENLPSPCIP